MLPGYDCEVNSLCKECHIIIYEGFKKVDIENDTLVKEFFDSRPISSGTRKNYLIWYVKYSNFTGMTPSELIEKLKRKKMNKFVVDIGK